MFSWKKPQNLGVQRPLRVLYCNTRLLFSSFHNICERPPSLGRDAGGNAESAISQTLSLTFTSCFYTLGNSLLASLLATEPKVI